MKGVQYVVDDHGEKRAVLIDLQVNKRLWEDFYDAALSAERASEPRESLEDVERQAKGSLNHNDTTSTT